MVKWTVLILEGRAIKRAIGRFASKTEATDWAIDDGWSPDQFVVIPFHD